MKNIQACILPFKLGTTCGKNSARISVGNSRFYHTKNSCEKPVGRGCLPWENIREECPKKDETHLAHGQARVLAKKEYPMMQAIGKRCIPGCPIEGLQYLQNLSQPSGRGAEC
ncbi:hypothetical protein JTB14_005596 [Gonioctena quinquepunctata]|nr:hypothetical protein JTB14_005596 [Gonioctena quinquepunctata]